MQFKNPKIKRNGGFTMVEMIISLFIIGMITTLVLANYTSGKRVAELNIAVQQLASDIRFMQNNTLGLVTNDKTGTIPEGGWGVYLDMNASVNQYIFFTDEDGEHDYDAGEDYETINISGDAFIDNISVDSSPVNSASIIFFPPDPATYINGESSSTIEIRLKEKTLDKSSTVLVNPYGLIEIIE